MGTNIIPPTEATDLKGTYWVSIQQSPNGWSVKSVDHTYGTGFSCQGEFMTQAEAYRLANILWDRAMGQVCD